MQRDGAGEGVLDGGVLRVELGGDRLLTDALLRWLLGLLGLEGVGGGWGMIVGVVAWLGVFCKVRWRQWKPSECVAQAYDIR